MGASATVEGVFVNDVDAVAAVAFEERLDAAAEPAGIAVAEDPGGDLGVEGGLDGGVVERLGVVAGEGEDQGAGLALGAA